MNSFQEVLCIVYSHLPYQVSSSFVIINRMKILFPNSANTLTITLKEVLVFGLRQDYSALVLILCIIFLVLLISLFLYTPQTILLIQDLVLYLCLVLLVFFSSL